MTRPCSCCSAYRSDRLRPLRLASLALAVGLGAGPASPAGAACPSCGTVTGAIAVEAASLRADGPKHDLDVVVMLEPVGATAPPAGGAHASMDQTGLVFDPHVLAVQRGTTVRFLNSDKEQHNVYFLDDRTGETLDIGTWGPGVSVDHTFDTPGIMITLCKLHLEMAAYVVVCPSPWFTAVRLDAGSSRARYEIAEVPAGQYSLAVWHKKLKQKGGTARITVVAGAKTEVDVVITKAKYAMDSD